MPSGPATLSRFAAAAIDSHGQEGGRETIIRLLLPVSNIESKTNSGYTALIKVKKCACGVDYPLLAFPLASAPFLSDLFPFRSLFLSQPLFISLSIFINLPSLKMHQFCRPTHHLIFLDLVSFRSPSLLSQASLSGYLDIVKLLLEKVAVY